TRLAELKLEAPVEEKATSTFIDRLNDFFKKEENVELECESEPMPETEEQLKRFFLDSIFQFQLNWASATLSQMSFLDRDYYNDLKLKYFLQRFPDTYLFMYHPVFKLKNAQVDADL